MGEHDLNHIKMPPLERMWLRCPRCGAKTILYDNTATCSGVFVKCTRGCGLIFEIKLAGGKPADDVH